MSLILHACRKGRPAPFCVLLALFVCCSFSSFSTIAPDSKTEWDYLKEQVEKLQKSLDSSWKERGKVSSIKDITALYYLYQRLSRINVAISNLQKLEESDYEYALDNITSNNEGYTSYDTDKKMIVFHINPAYPAIFVHETTHGGQFQRKELIFNRTTGRSAGDDVDDELEAYRAQFAFDPASLVDVKSPEMITASWLFGLKRTPTAYMYNLKKPDSLNSSNTIALIPINVNSDSTTLRRAFPAVNDPWGLLHPMQDTDHYFYYKSK